jgi:DNA-binding response OmpR family regulator
VREVLIKKKILVIIDNSDVCEILSFNLEKEGHDVSMAFSVEEAFQKLTPDCDLIMIDIISGDKHSEFKLIEQHHKKCGIPIIFLSELKPFVFRELLDHVKTVLKITKVNNISENVTEVGDIFIDYSSKEAKIEGSTISLTKMEFEILYLFASNPFKTYSRQQIINAVWKDSRGCVTRHAVDMHIARLRKKLGSKANCITSRLGFGYKFDPTIAARPAKTKTPTPFPCPS